MKIGLLSRSPIGNNFGKQNSGKVEVQKGFEQNNINFISYLKPLNDFFNFL